jgi:hypothetical protein
MSETENYKPEGDEYEFALLAHDAMEWVSDLQEWDEHLQALECARKAFKWIAAKGRLDLSDAAKRVELHIFSLAAAARAVHGWRYEDEGGKPDQVKA